MRGVTAEDAGLGYVKLFTTPVPLVTPLRRSAQHLVADLDLGIWLSIPAAAKPLRAPVLPQGKSTAHIGHRGAGEIDQLEDELDVTGTGEVGVAGSRPFSGPSCCCAC